MRIRLARLQSDQMQDPAWVCLEAPSEPSELSLLVLSEELVATQTNGPIELAALLRCTALRCSVFPALLLECTRLDESESRRSKAGSGCAAFFVRRELSISDSGPMEGGRWPVYILHRNPTMRPSRVSLLSTKESTRASDLLFINLVARSRCTLSLA
ncbi:hypothetical protein BJX62DRAFT_128841 [Aspergillus germanicus]